MQRTLMEASDQTIPAVPQLHKGLIMYGALCLEEPSEMLAALSKACLDAAADAGEDEAITLGCIATQLEVVAETMHKASLTVRQHLNDFPDDFIAQIAREHVIEMADGTTDTAVVNSGFALSLGVDGAACYAEVAGSNLSKRNPDTGRIDKEPNGKWIKGRDYYAPNLATVVFPQPEAAMVHWQE